MGGESHITGELRDPVGIAGDVTILDWDRLCQLQERKYGEMFGVVTMDPPWDVGLDLHYPVLREQGLMRIPLRKL